MDTPAAVRPTRHAVDRRDRMASPGRSTPSALTVQQIDAETHDRYAVEHHASFLQIPQWAAVKAGWRSESLGWFRAGELVGTALVLYRLVPGGQRSLAYLPEGPTLPWAEVVQDPDSWLKPLLGHLRGRLAFAVRIGPSPVVRIWHAATVKRGLAEPAVRRFDDLPPDERVLEGHTLGTVLAGRRWQPLDREPGFGAGQPRYGLRIDLSGRSVTDLLTGANQQWRRNVIRSAKAGVVVREGSIADLPVFHRLYLETAERDGFTPRPESYFVGMWKALSGGAEPKLRIYLAELGPGAEPLAAALIIDVGRHCWYSYGASTSRHREAQASTALQWHAIQAALGRGCETYDLRGIADTLDPSEGLAGLVRFKLGTGGSCVETVGEWELTLSPLWHTAFKLYRKVRS